MTIYKNYTHAQRMAGKALREESGPAKERILTLTNALENILNEYGEFIELVESKGNKFSHGVQGQISNVYRI